MAPSAESSNVEDMETATTYPQYAPQSSLSTTPSKNVAFAVNYELPMVDQFLSVHRDSRRKTLLRRSRVESPTNSTQDYQSHPSMPTIAETNTSSATITSLFGQSGIHRIQSNLENDTPNITTETVTEVSKESTASSSIPLDLSSPSVHVSTSTSSAHGRRQSNHQELLQSKRRISTRDKNKREVPLARTRVKYDMQLVPLVRRNPLFLKRFASCWRTTTSSSSSSCEEPEKRRSCRFVSSSTQAEVQSDSAQTKETDFLETPFFDDKSVVWIPTKRSEWEDTISEMTAVCTSAAMRRSLLQPLADKTKAALPFQPPLSRDYIRDRIDIDDPLNGYQIRHRDGGWMQGFILYTTFTTWTYGFRWDSQHPLCGIDTGTFSNPFVDHDGSLAMELESLSRSGDPGAGGIVFPAIAEIGLLGGLGCGEYLLRMALDDISTKVQYRYVVLQATDQSRAFYERFGFVRVGAICQYCGGGKASVHLQNRLPIPPSADHPPEVVGYRHWTHANESEKSLQMHGGPSYMMCLKLPDRTVDVQPGAFVESLLKLRVETKPRVEQLGPSTTPVVRRSFSMPIEISASFDGGHLTATLNESLDASGVVSKETTKRGPTAKLSRRKSFATFPVSVAHSANRESDATDAVPNPKDVAPVASPKVAKVSKVSSKRECASSLDRRPSKRLKVADDPVVKKRGRPPVKANLQRVHVSAYVEKQYNSIWLAVSPVSASASPPRRPPPKSRDSTETLPSVGDHTRKAVENNRRMEKSETGRGTRSQPMSSKKRSFVERTDTDGENSSIANRARCPVSLIESILSGESAPVLRMALRKQKVVSYPRNRVHFYNRVVKRKNEVEGRTARVTAGTTSSNVFYFVLEYHEEKALLCLVPLAITGKLTGKRVGRPRYQCSVNAALDNFIVADAINYIVVPSAMIMKTPVVAQEAWDIATETDVHFSTR
jgi:hypothetical protein